MLKKSGSIRAVSAGMNQRQMLVRFVDEGVVDCILLAGRHTLLGQSAMAGGLLAKGQKAGIRLIVRGVFNNGIPADPDLTPQFDYAPTTREARGHA